MSSSDRHIGTRAYGQRPRREPWYESAVLGRVVPESETIILNRPGDPRDGMRVWVGELDAPGYDDALRAFPPTPHSDEEV
jgi:hypothetical protein